MLGIRYYKYYYVTKLVTDLHSLTIVGQPEVPIFAG